MNIEKLIEGNVRYVRGKLSDKDYAKAREELADEQHPYAVIFGCSDSRVSPEIIFDAGLGELFVIRTAGHVVDQAALGSIEYAVEHLHVKLIVVLGHAKCGAVTAAVKESEEEGEIAYLVEAIQPSAEDARDLGGKEDDIISEAISLNVKRVVGELKEDSMLGGAKIVGARYDLESGRVSLV